MEKITSLQNNTIKNVVALQEKSRERKQQGLFVAEGLRELGLALEGGFEIKALFVCYETGGDKNKFLASLSPKIPVQEVSKPVFDKIAYRENSDGLLALLQVKSQRLEDIRLSDNPLVIVLQAIEKPGNLGAILRTADAAQADAIVVCDPLCDTYNPNVVRSGIGCLFTNQLAVCTSEEALAWLHKHHIMVLAAELEASQWYHQTDMSKPCALVMGAEATGLSEFWLKNADARIKIPMRGKIDSLNVSVSTAVLVFEAMRQRNFNE